MTNIEKIEQNIIKNLQEVVKLRNNIVQSDNERHDERKRFFLEIISVLDMFENTEEMLANRGMLDHADSQKVMKRYKTIQKGLLRVLENNEVEKIEFSNNKFDLNTCEVADTHADTSKENDDILSIIRKGYIFKKQLVIRKAQVIVIKNDKFEK